MKRGKILVLVFILLALINFISSIEISEVELNPPGNDVGSEWVEFHSEDRVDLGRYRIVNGDGKEILLSGGFQGYFVYVFQKQWLDNSDEKVFLYEGDNLVYETPILNDSANDEKTWQLCGDKWEFLKSTKGRANACSTNETVKEETIVEENTANSNQEPEENQKNDVATKEVANKVENLSSPLQEEANNTPIVSEVIKLNTKTIKSNNITKVKESGNYAIYGLIILGVLLGFLFFLRRRKYKNEFRK